MSKNPTSFRLSEECLRLLARLSETLGINQTAVIEQAVRKLARAELSDESEVPGPRGKAGKER
jgi:hypothetical protein